MENTQPMTPAQPTGAPAAAPSGDAQGYCVKCREKRTMAGAEKVTMKSGREAMKGKCSTCGTGMYSMLKGPAKKAA